MLLDHLGTGALVGARLVDAGFFAATVSLTALVPVFTLTRWRVHITFTAFLFFIPSDPVF